MNRFCPQCWRAVEGMSAGFACPDHRVVDPLPLQEILPLIKVALAREPNYGSTEAIDAHVAESGPPDTPPVEMPERLLRAPVTTPRCTRSTRGSVMTSEWMPRSRRSPRKRSISFGATQADLQGRAIVNDPRHVTGDPFRRRPQRLVQVFDHGVIDRHDLVETVEGHLAGGTRAGHVRT